MAPERELDLPAAVADRRHDARRRPAAGRSRAAGPRDRGQALDAAGAPSPASIGLILADDARAGRPQRDPHGPRRSDRRAVVPAPPAATRSAAPGRGRRERRERPAPASLRRSRPGARPHLGDIVISVERATEQAEAGPRRPDRRRPLVAGRRAAPARDPRHAPRLRLGPRRPGRGGRDARPRAPAPGLGAGRADRGGRSVGRRARIADRQVEVLLLGLVQAEDRLEAVEDALEVGPVLDIRALGRAGRG